MTPTLRETAKQVLEVLIRASSYYDTYAEIAVLEAALAEPERKPLTEVDLRALYGQHAAYQEEGPEASGWWDFARAIERAHGIGEQK